MMSMQRLYCQICAREFEWDFNLKGGYGPHRQCCCRNCYDEYEYRMVLAIMGKPYERMSSDYKASLEKKRDRTEIMNLKITKKTPPGYAVEHVVTAKNVDITLYMDPDEKKPRTIGLYIWQLCQAADHGFPVIKAAIEEITGAKVKTFKVQAGNGHGEIQVEYEES